MSFLNYFSTNPQFDPNDPNAFDYMQQARKLRHQQELAQQFGNVQAFGGMGKGATLAFALQKALGGIMTGTRQRDELNLDKAAKGQFEHYRRSLNDMKSQEELRAEAMQFYKNPEMQYTHKPGIEVGPSIENMNKPYSAARDSQAAYAAMGQGTVPMRQSMPTKLAGRSFDPAARVGTERGRGTNTGIGGDGIEAMLMQRDVAAKELAAVNKQLGTMGSVQRQRDPMAFNALQAQASELQASIRSIENQVAPAAGAMRQPMQRPMPPAPAAMQQAPMQQQPSTPAAIPQQPVPPAAMQQAPMQQQPLTLEDTFNRGYDPTEVSNTIQSRSNFVRDAMLRQENERMQAMSAMETNPRAQSFLKQMAARQANVAEQQKFMFEQNYKAKLSEREQAGKVVGTPQTAADGRLFITNGRGDVTFLNDAGKSVRDPKIVSESNKKTAGAVAALAKSEFARSQIREVLGSNAPEQATGWSGAFGQLLSKARITNDWQDARMKILGLTSQAIAAVAADMAASGQSANQQMNTPLEAAQRAAAMLNANVDGMSDVMIRAEIQKFDAIIATAQSVLRGQIDLTSQSGGSANPTQINGVMPFQRGVTIRPPGQ